MFLSFIVPVYNTEVWLPECLESLLHQDLLAQDYEILCINDGSTDGSGAILQAYQNAHENIRVLEQENSGVAAARNAGMDAAAGEYLWFVDSDDVIKPNCIREIRRIITENKLERMKIGTYTFDGDAAVCVGKEGLKVNSHFYDSSVCNSVLSREFLKKHGCRFRYPGLTHGEDSIFMFEAVAHKPKADEWDIPIYFYRNRPGSAMTAQSAAALEKKLNAHFLAAKIMKKHYDNGIGEPRDTSNLLMSFIWYTMNECAALPRQKRAKMLREIKTAGLWPFIRSKTCTHRRSYQTTRTDLPGKLFDWIYIHTHTIPGFYLMLLWNRAYSLYRSLRKALHKIS